MSIVVVNSDQINTAIGGEATGNSGSQLVTLSTGDELYVAEDVFMAADGSLVDVGNIDFIDVIYNGDGFSGSNAFRFDRSSSEADFDFEHSLTIGSDATITTLSSLGFFGVLASSLGLLDDGSEFDFFNAGTASSTDGRGFEFQSIALVRAVNTGTIHSGVGPTMVFENNIRANFTNTGTLTNGRDFVTGIVDHLEATVGFNNTVQNMTMVNSGTIIGNIASVFSSANTSEDLQNTGTIAGDIYLSNTVGGILVNSGDITGDIFTKGGDDFVTNTGSITGSIDLGDDADTFDGRGGSISGAVIGGDGDDTFIIEDGTIELVEALDEGIDTVQTAASYALADNIENLDMIGGSGINAAGNDLDNVMNGNVGDNKLYGLDGDDLMSGLEGNDVVKGGEGDDTLYGDDGNDLIFGGVDNDRLFGGGGDDILEGRRGVDRIYGGDGDDFLDGAGGNDLLVSGDGDDILDGGAGLDKMTGGDGIDTFVWNSASESKDTSKADQVNDFEIGVDRLDFLDAMSGDFDVNIAGSFTGGGTASLYTVETGGNTEVFADVDGDGSIDMRVDLLGTSGVTEGDFIV